MELRNIYELSVLFAMTAEIFINLGPDMSTAPPIYKVFVFNRAVKFIYPSKDELKNF